MQICLIDNKDIWEDFIKSQPEYTFLHSWNWGEFSVAMGHKIWRLGIYDGEELVGAALVVGIRARRGSFLFIPHGPITKTENENLKTKNYSEKLKTFIVYLNDLAKEEKCSFIRISPLLKRNKENFELFKELGFRRASIHMHAESTLLLDITKPEEELLKNMRKTTRYLIKRMEKEGVEIAIENPPLGENFLRLQNKVAEKKHFIVFSEKQIKNEIKIFCPDSQLVVFNAGYEPPENRGVPAVGRHEPPENRGVPAVGRHEPPENRGVPAVGRTENEIVASALIVFYGYRAFYYQSASYTEHKNISAPYLLVWRAIQEAKKRGCAIFDFYGASPADKPNHPWAGPTLFKLGFGTERIDYLPAQDLVLNWKYWITYFIEIIRKIKRGF